MKCKYCHTTHKNTDPATKFQTIGDTCSKCNTTLLILKNTILTTNLHLLKHRRKIVINDFTLLKTPEPTEEDYRELQNQIRENNDPSIPETSYRTYP